MLVLAIISLCFTFTCCAWLTNFAFAIFGSSVISGVISLVNYFTMRRKVFVEISEHYYTLAYTYRQVIHNVAPLKSMFNLTKKEKEFKKLVISLSDKIVYLADQYRYEIAGIKSDLDKGKNTDDSVEAFDKKVKNPIRNILKDIACIEEIVFSKKELKFKRGLREKFKEEFGDLLCEEKQKKIVY